MGNELIKLIFPYQILKIEEKNEPFFIRNARERIIRILALQINDQFGKVVVRTELLDRVSQGLPSNDGREVPVRLAMPIKKMIS